MNLLSALFFLLYFFFISSSFFKTCLHNEGSALAVFFNGFSVKVGKTQRCQSLAENVVKFLGCAAPDSAAASLLR